MRRLWSVAIIAVSALVLLAGCAEQQAATPADTAEMGAAGPEDTTQPAQQDTPIKLDAYINVSSGCQDWTVDVLNELDEKYDSIDTEIIDFGLPEGKKRMEENGVDCMTLLFDGSPVIQIPDEAGGTRTVTFYFPVGFGWTHDDLRDAFAALDSGEAKILTEDEARKALAPREVDVTVATEETDEGANLLMNDQVVLTITEDGGGQTPIERADAAKAAIEDWTSEKVDPHQLKVLDADEGWTIMGRDTELIHVYPADAEAADVSPGKKLAAAWFKGIRCGVVAAARAAQDDAGPDAGTICITGNMDPEQE